MERLRGAALVDYNAIRSITTKVCVARVRDPFIHVIMSTKKTDTFGLQCHPIHHDQGKHAVLHRPHTHAHARTHSIMLDAGDCSQASPSCHVEI